MSLQTTKQESTMVYTILYIEDDQANRDLVQLILSRRDDLSIITAEDGASGIKMAVQDRPDIILLDLSLPDMDGYEVLEKLQNNAQTNHIPVIAVSGNCLPEDVQQGMDSGLHGYLPKPISVTELYTIIDSTIATF